MYNCKDCGYRRMMATLFDTHVWGIDCDKCGTRFCEESNELDSEEKVEVEDGL